MVGNQLVELDCKDVCARVMELLITGRPTVLAGISHHYQDGQKMNLDVARNFVKGKSIFSILKF